MSSKYTVHPLEKKFIKDTTGVDLDAPSKLSHEEFMRLKEGNMTEYVSVQGVDEMIQRYAIEGIENEYELGDHVRYTDHLAKIVRLQAELQEYAKDTLRLIATIKYLSGIAAKGEGREIKEDETVEQFVLGYVKRLEAELGEWEDRYNTAMQSL